MTAGLYMPRAGRDDWETPAVLFAELHSEFRFTLDAAATPSNAKCARYHTATDNGLAHSWDNERVWVNPPYGQNTIPLWVRKARRESVDRGATVVMLLPARTDAIWFHDVILPHAEIRFLKGRLSFGDGAGRAPFPSMVVVFRPTPLKNHRGV